MYLINAMNVRDALLYGIQYLVEYGEIEQTRLGDAIVAPGPVTIHYKHPKQHVLLDRYRDANPFFHLMEAMWMLAGRNDSAFLDHYIKNFGKLFALNGLVPDAYGYRWRRGQGFCQLTEIIKQIQDNAASRQLVLQMWGSGIKDLLTVNFKPCNLVVTFRVKKNNKLDMHVFNRSNDLVLGCCGANAVHFPIMQEYVAARAGLEVGEYWQVSTNLHMYMEHYNRMSQKLGNGCKLEDYFEIDSYGLTQPLMEYPDNFDDDLSDTMLYIDDLHAGREGYTGNIANPFLRDVVVPMATAHQLYKMKDMDRALEAMTYVTAADWQQAGTEWLKRRGNR